MPATRAACTIVSPNYLAYASTLAASYLQHHPGHQFFVLIVSAQTDPTPFQTLGFTPVMLPELGIPNLKAEAMKYDILELNTNVKPSFMKYLLKTHQLDTLTYLDPDIFCYAPFESIHAELDNGANAVVTPHLCSPVLEGSFSKEQDALYNGTYNLGFIAVRASTETTKLLHWWEDRCLAAGFSEGRSGLFVDQKWINLAPGLFSGISILRDPGCNMAYWNLHERKLLKRSVQYEVASPIADLTPLRFFHFSGIDVTDPNVLSKNIDTFTLTTRPDLTEIFAAYKTAVLANKGADAESLPYGFDTFTDGITITRLARRLYAAHIEHFTNQDPFDATGPFAQFARAQLLVKGVIAPAKAGWKQFTSTDRRVSAVHKLLKVALRLIGPHKYELLMRYLAHIAILRNQSVFLRDPSWPNEAGKTTKAGK